MSSSKQIDLKDLVPIMKEQLDQGKTVSFVPSGKSMKPMLDDGKDMIILKKPKNKLRIHDVALYYRAEDSKYVVHRVVGFEKNGSYIMRGDNNIMKEHNIPMSDVIGVVTAYYHKGKMREVDHPLYRIYCDFWFYTCPIRAVWRRIKPRR